MMRPPRTANHGSSLSALVARRFAERPATELSDELWQRSLLGPANDFLLRPGKQLRARLCDAAWILAGGDAGGPPPELPAIVEILHAGSLIVDDIEDGSHERRGEQALHVRHGVPLALNTGNWLYFVALDLIGRLPLPAEVRFSLYRAASTTLLRCHEGQALDLALSVDTVPAHQLADVVATTTQLKTASLMELSATMGALAAGGLDTVVAALGSFGGDLGIGLQMLDDLGGLGKTRRHKGREDLRLRRPTWPWAWLVEEDPARAAELLSWLGDTDDAALDRVCDALAEAVGERGRLRTLAHLGAAWNRLTVAVGPSDALDTLGRDLMRWAENHG